MARTRERLASTGSRSQKEARLETYDAHKNDVEARQASRRFGNFWVLIISTAVVIALFAIIFLITAGNTPPSAISP